MRDPLIAANPTLTNMIRRRAQNTPNAIALWTPAREYSYAQLHMESSRMARGLLALGLGRDDRIACYTKSSVECLISLLAAAKIGAACAVFNWRLAAPELEYVVNQSEAKFLLSDSGLMPMIERIKAPNIKDVRLTDSAQPEHSLALWRQAQSAEDTGLEPSPQDTVLQLNSSGTTGLPKSVALSHQSLITQCNMLGPLFGIDKVERIVQLNALPNFHVSGMVNMLSMLFEGGTSISYPEFVPSEIVKAFAKHQITHTFLVPAMIQFLLEVPGVEQADFSSLIAISYGGSPIAESLLVRAMKAFKCDFYQVYGMTEIGGSFSVLPPADHDPAGPRAHLLRSAGKPGPSFDVRIVDPASGQDMAEGETGEIWAYANTFMNGYFKNPAATEAAFPLGRGESASWYRTGDAGCLREGYIYIQDRVKDMIISGGENIYPAEIENVLVGHPDVIEAAVIGVPDERWGEAVKACVVLRAGRPTSAEQLIAHCRQALAGYKCPKSVDFVDSLPRNPSGKLLKRLLRDPYWVGRDRQV
jgi:acyl-CoA synthetase (AMP-forming)/AMP-acid ligase II